jgi:hypothetical protein
MTPFEEALSLLKASLKHLVDCMIMFEDIERARELPPTAQARAQYVAKGREIRAFVKQITELTHAQS